MDVCCDLIVPVLAEVPELVTMLGPDGEAFAYGPHVRLARRPMPQHIAARLPPALRTLDSYRVTGDGLDLLDYEVNGREPIWRGPTFVDLLKAELGGRRPWAFVFEWHCDQIDEVFAVAEVNALIERLRSNLDWQVERKGFIAYRE